MSSCKGLISLPETDPQVVKPVTISYDELRSEGVDLSRKIEDGFGRDGLGIVVVTGVPQLDVLRRNLLHLSVRLASLPEEVKEKLEDPDSRYNFGWSHGKEKVESGKLDMLKGSFYANPIIDVPSAEASLLQRYPSYCRPNIWPRNDLPELEFAFKSLGNLIFDVGVMLAGHCDQYVSKEVNVSEVESLKHMLQRSRCHKGRLLYYFPKQKSVLGEEAGSMSSWCGWHTDHGSLTGLTCAMFMRGTQEVPCPDATAGLYIKTRMDQIVKVVFSDDELAYQIGEMTEILSHGYLCATPHCVQAPKNDMAYDVSRATFALFMQPNWDENLKFPSSLNLHQELIEPNDCLTFGEYSEKLLNKYYHQRN
ncbi:uncharacterized protein LOC116256490 isoform X2 [Nymphaea colorata]|uniref:uncharacterized protein LOC116256490 isoform X2 n=1 Tax=Nymphaea colorata TaxID=210225 RepID=UPI00129D33D5|nr:uncharacterized protein LOC116256490 isoform X2 [Nymphaea colorata]